MTRKLHSIAAGAASLFDLSSDLRHPATLYRRLGLPAHIADALALQRDWERVGQDLETALHQFAETTEESPETEQLELFEAVDR